MAFFRFPALLTYFLSFMTLGIFWTGILSSHITNKVSIEIYWLNILALGGLLFIHWQYAHKHHCLTFRENEGELINKAVRSRIIIAQSLYALGAGLCFVSTYLSIFVIIIIQLNYALAFFNPKSSK